MEIIFKKESKHEGNDCMIYGVEFKNGRKEYISRELFVLLKELLHE